MYTVRMLKQNEIIEGDFLGGRGKILFIEGSIRKG
jgi:hypothetical protein